MSRFKPRDPKMIPPLDCDPSSASNHDLKKFGYPPRPDPKNAPKASAIWEAVATCRPRYFQSRYSVRPLAGLDESWDWSGAVLSTEEDESPYNQIIGSWIVPNIHPKQNYQGNNVDGHYQGYI
jgi:hypothetical protein